MSLFFDVLESLVSLFDGGRRKVLAGCGLLFAGAFLWGADITIAAGDSQTLSSYTNNDTITVYGTLTCDGSALENHGKIINYGTINFNAGVINYSGATITNTASGIVDCASSCTNYGTISNAGTFVSQGDFTNFSGGTVTNTETFTIKTNLNNSGLIETSSVFTVGNSDSGYATGSVTNQNTGIINVTAGSFTSVVGSISNNGVLAVASGATLSGTVSGNAATSSVAFTWDGSEDSDWETAANWTPAVVPTSGSDVTIPAGCSNYPETSATVTLNTVSIASGASLTLGNTFKAVSMTNDGTLNIANSSANTTLTGDGTVYSGDGDIKVYSTGIPLFYATGTDSVIEIGGDLDMTSSGGTLLFEISATKSIAISGDVTGNTDSSNGDFLNFRTTPAVTISGKVSTEQIEVNSSTTITFEDDVYVPVFINNLGAKSYFKGDTTTLIMLTDNGTCDFTGTSVVFTKSIDYPAASITSSSGTGKTETFKNLTVDSGASLTTSATLNITGQTTVLGNLDLSGASGFTASGAVWFFNTTSSNITWKTFDGLSIGTLQCAGNITFGLTGALTIDSFNVPNSSFDSGNYIMSDDWDMYFSNVSGGSVTISSSFDANGSVKDNGSSSRHGTIHFDTTSTINADSSQLHFGSGISVESGAAVTFKELKVSSYTNVIPVYINVDGTLNVTTLDLCGNNNKCAGVLTVGSSGKVNATGIAYTSTQTATGVSTVTNVVENSGEITVGTGGFVVTKSKKNVLNNGTISTNGAASISALTFSGSGTLKITNGNGSIKSESTTDTSSQGTLECDYTTIIGGKWSVTNFKAENLGEKAITLNESTISVSTALSLSGSSASKPLYVYGNSAGDGFIFAGDLDGGSYLSIDSTIAIFDSSSKTGTYTYTATNSVPSAGTTDSDYAAVIKNGWNIKDRKLFNYVWKGGATSGTASSGTTLATDWSNEANWEIGLVPVTDCTVTIPSGLSNYPVVPSSSTTVTEYNAGNLTLSGSDSKITVNSANLVLSGKAGTSAATTVLSNAGTIVYKAEGRITDDSSAVLNDVTQGTVEYASSGSGTVSVIAAAATDPDYYNLAISGGTWTIPDTIVAANALTVSGGTFNGTCTAASVSVTGEATANGDFTFITDSIDVKKKITATDYTASIKPKTTTVPVSVGGEVAGSLSLTSTEVSYLSAKIVSIGDETNTAGLTITESLSVNSGIYLITGGTMTQSTSGTYNITSVKGELKLQAADGIGNISGSAPVTVGSVADTVSAKITGSGDIYLKISSAAILGGTGSKVILTPNGNIKIETTGAMTLGGDIEASSGTLGLTSGGAITHTGGTLSSSSTVTLEAAAAIGSASSPVEIAAASNVIAKTSGTTTASGVYLCQNGTLTVSAAGDIATAKGPVLLKATGFGLATGSVGTGSGTVTLTGYDETDAITLSQTEIDGINQTTSRQLVVGDSEHTGDITFTGDINVSGFGGTTIQAQSIESSSASFTSGSDRPVTLLPVDSEMTLTGGFTFDYLSAAGLGGSTLYFEAGSTTNVTGGITLSGTSKTSRLALRSTTDDSQWKINCTCGEANTSIEYVDVKDSNNTSTNGGTAYDLTAGPSSTSAASQDSGNNDNWSFPGQAYKWTGASSTDPTVWKNKANWEPKSIPCKGGVVTIPAGLTKYPLIEATDVDSTYTVSLGSGTLTIEADSTTPGRLDLSTYKFAAKSITNNGLVRMAGGNEITVDGVVVSTGSTTALSNGPSSTVEYYGDTTSTPLESAALPWGKTYQNLVFSSDSTAGTSAKAALPDTYVLTVKGTTSIDCGTGNDISLPAANVWGGAVSIASGGDVTLGGNSSGLTLKSGAECDSLEITCQAKIGDVTTTENQTYGGNVILTEDSELTAGSGKLVWFKGTVEGNSTASGEHRILHVVNADARFDGKAGSGKTLNSVIVDGNTEINCEQIYIVDGKTTTTPGAGEITLSGDVTLGSNIEFDGNDSTFTAGGSIVSKDTTARSVTVKSLDGIFAGDIGSTTAPVSSLSVSGTTSFTKAAAQTVLTTGEQTYTKDVTFASDLTLTACDSSSGSDVYSTVTFGTYGTPSAGAAITGPADLTVNAKVTAATASHTFDLTKGTSCGKALFNQGFTDGAYVVLKGNGSVTGSNTFNLLQVDNSAIEEQTTLTFDENSTQTIKNAVGSPATVHFAGNSETNFLLITDGVADSNWNVVFSNKLTVGNFSYVKAENSSSITAAGAANKLGLVPAVAYVQDTNNSDYTTTNWFTTDFYWVGGTDTSWLTAANWSYSSEPASPVTALAYPDYSSGTTAVKVIDDVTRLTLASGETGAIKVESLSVAEGKSVDFADQNVTLTGTAPQITNNGTILLAGSQTVNVVLADLTTVDVSEGTVTALSNGTASASAVEYYGACGTKLALGKTYNNLNFADGASAALAAPTASVPAGYAVTVAAAATIASGTGNDIALEGKNTFTGGVTVTSGGNVVLNSASGFTLEAGAGCDALHVESAVKLSDVTTTELLDGSSTETQVYDGAVTSDGSISFTGPADDTVSFGANLSAKGSITVAAKTAFKNASAQAVTSTAGQIYKGDVTSTAAVNMTAGSGAATGDTSKIEFYSANYTAGADQTLTAPGGIFLYAHADKNWSGTFNFNNDFAVFGPNYSADDPRYSGTDTRFELYGFGTYSKPADITDSESTALLTGGTFNAKKNFYVNGADISISALNLPDNSSSTSAATPVFNPAASATGSQWGTPFAVAFNSKISSTAVGCLTSGGTSYLAAGASDSVSTGATQGCEDGSGNTNVQFNVPHIDQAYSVYDDVLYVHFDMSLENSHGEIAANLALSSSGSLASGGAWYSDGTYYFAGAYEDAECKTALTKTDTDHFYLKAAETWNTDATGLLATGDTTTDGTKITDAQDSTDRNGVHKNIKTDLSFLEGLFTAAEGHTMGCNYGTGLENGAAAQAYTATGDQCAPVLTAVYTGQELHDAYVQATGTSSQHEYDGHNFIELRYSEAVNLGDLSYNGADVNAAASDSFDSAAAHGGNIANSDSTIEIAGYAKMAGALNAGIRPDCTTVTSPHALYRLFSAKAGDTAVYQSHRVRISIAGYVDGTVSYTDSESSESGTFHKWAGYINSGTTPSGTVTRVAGDYITDIAGNKLSSEKDSAGGHVLPEITVNGFADSRLSSATSLYGDWDTIAPVVSPFVTSKDDWNSWCTSGSEETSEIIGSTTGSLLEHVEVHFLDNNSTAVTKWPAQWWRTRRGWQENGTETLPDTAGGARPFTTDSNVTTGGIRRSSLYGAASSFTYKTIIDETKSDTENSFAAEGTKSIRQKMNGSIFRSSTDAQTTNDGLFAGLPLKDGVDLAVRTTFELFYDPTDDYITDLAGNRLASSYSEKTSFNSVDLTPPSYSMTLSPVAEDKVYVIFTKRLGYVDSAGTQYNLDELSGSKMTEAMTEIAESFVVCTAGASDSQIEITKAELSKYSAEYTTLLLTLERKLTLSDIEGLWLRDVGHGSDTVVDTLGETVSDTKIRDYIGNYLAQNKAHTISDFAVNAVNVLYAYGHEKNDDNWDEQGIYGTGVAAASSDYAVHDFTRNQGNYGKLTSGRDITLQVRTISGVDSEGEYTAPSESFLLMPANKNVISSDMVSDKINKLTKSDWRVWLPTELTSLATDHVDSADLTASPASPDSADEGAGILWNYSFPDEDYGFKGGDEIQFVFKVQNGGSDVMIDHDADDTTSKVPLYALTMPESRIRAGDFSFVDLWSFGIKDQKKQRGSVTILNNVINVSNREQTVVEVDMNEDGNLNVYVMTLDGNIIKRLAHGRNNSGTHYYRWDGTNNAGNSVARGMYFVRVVGPGIDETRKVMCVKD